MLDDRGANATPSHCPDNLRWADINRRHGVVVTISHQGLSDLLASLVFSRPFHSLLADGAVKQEVSWYCKCRSAAQLTT